MTANERQTKATEEWLVLLKIDNELNEEEYVFYVPGLKCPGYLRQPFSICPPPHRKLNFGRANMLQTIEAFQKRITINQNLSDEKQQPAWRDGKAERDRKIKEGRKRRKARVDIAEKANTIRDHRRSGNRFCGGATGRGIVDALPEWKIEWGIESPPRFHLVRRCTPGFARARPMSQKIQGVGG